MGPWPRHDDQAGGVEKAPTGIAGLDEITVGGLPRGRATVVTGAAGSGKSLFGAQFLVRGALDHGEPGVLLSFEESADELVGNARSLGLDLQALVDDGRLVVDSAVGQTDDLVQSGDFDLEGLLLRLRGSIEAVGARRVVLDTVETLFAALPDPVTVRREFGRLLRWLKGEGLTVVVTAEKGEGRLTRHGVEEYVSDCVVVLDQRIEDEVATRRLRVAKYRGSAHATNEFPFLLTSAGVVVMPIHQPEDVEVGDERIGLGIESLDEMLGGGVFRGTTTMISGSAGTGKTSIAVAAADAACRRGERALFLSLEEPSRQIVRNMRSIGFDLQHWIDEGLLEIRHMRPSVSGLEEHLAALQMTLDRFDADVVVVDAVGSLGRGVSTAATASVIARDISLLRARGVTTFLTALAEGGDLESTDVSASSLVDAWLLLRNEEADGERNRLLFTIKNRGSHHSNQVREFLLTDQGPELVDVFVGPEGVLTGSRRVQQEEKDARERERRTSETDRLRVGLERRRAEVEEQIATLRRELAAEVAEATATADRDETDATGRASDRAGLAQRRSGSAT